MRCSPHLLACSLLASILLSPLAHAGDPDGITSPRPQPQPILGGQAATTCQWPNTAAIGGASCTGTLIHPRLVVYAAHCGPQSPSFGESGFGGRSVQVDHCRSNPAYAGVSDQDHDWSYCLLAGDVGLPITPPMFGCELDKLEAGLPIVIAGFGGPNNGRKYWAETYVNFVSDNTVNIGGNGVAACMGDSGGPAYAKMSDGTYRAFGIVSTGTTCGNAVEYARIDKAIPWIEQESGLDLTPCHDADGTWNPTIECGSFLADGENVSGSWNDWCAGTPAGGFSDTCGAPFNQDPDDTAPTVTITSPVDGEMFTDAPQTLSITLDADDGTGWGVKQVWITIDGTDPGAVDATAPYSIDGVDFPMGVYTLVGHAEDEAGNVGESAPVTIGVGEDVPDPTGGGTSDGGSETGDGTADGGTSAGDATAGGSGESGAGDGGDDGKGCSCSAPDRDRTLPWLIGLVLVATRRRTSTP